MSSIRGFISKLLPKSTSAVVAKERLQIILSQQRGAMMLDGVDVGNMQNDLSQVISVCISSLSLFFFFYLFFFYLFIYLFIFFVLFLKDIS